VYNWRIIEAWNKISLISKRSKCKWEIINLKSDFANFGNCDEIFSHYLGFGESKENGEETCKVWVSKDSNEILRFRFMSMLDLADSSTKEAKRMQLNLGGMDFAWVIRPSCTRNDERNRERERERERERKEGREGGPKTPSPRLLHFGDELSSPSATRNSRPSVLQANSPREKRELLSQGALLQLRDNANGDLNFTICDVCS